MTKGKKPSQKRANPGQVVTREKGKPKADPVSLPKAVTWLLVPQHMFVLLALVFGSAFIITTPPFQVPDEPAHFFRTFSLSEFDVAQEVQGTLTGDVLPSSLDSAASIFNYLKFVPANKVPDGQIGAAMRIPLKPDQRRFVRVTAGNYFYPSYLPQLPIVWIGKWFDLPVLSILYLGRFAALLFYVFFLWWAIRVIPVGKHLLLGIALMPMCLAQAGSYSADCVAHSFAFLCVALSLAQARNTPWRWRSKEAIALVFMFLVIGVLKPIFLPLLLLVFAIPIKRFGSKGQYWLFAAGTIIVSVFLAVLWLKQMSSQGLYQVQVDISGRPINPSGKIQELINNPWIFFDVLFKTLDYFGDLYFKSMIGVIGYLDTFMPNWLYWVYAALLVAITLFEGVRGVLFSWKKRSLLLAASVTIFLATILALHIYTRVKSGLVAEGGQGRYFIPALFPFLLGFHACLPVRVSLSRRPTMAALYYVLLAALLITAETVLYARYYG